MLKSPTATSVEQSPEIALEKIIAIFDLLKIYDYFNHSIKLKFIHFFNTCPPSIQQKLCSINLESFKEMLYTMHPLEAENIGNYFRQEIQNDLVPSHEIFNLYEILLQSPTAFSLAQKIRKFIFDSTMTPTQAASPHQFRLQVKQTLEEKSGWNVESCALQRMKSLEEQQKLIDDFRYAVIDYRKKVNEDFCLGENLYRRKNGIYSLDNFNVFLQESDYIPDDHLEALFKFTQMFMYMDIGEHLDFPSQPLEAGFSLFYQALPMDMKKILHRTDLSKFEQYFNMLEPKDKKEVIELFVGKSYEEQFIAYLFLLDTVSSLPAMLFEQNASQASILDSLSEPTNTFLPSAPRASLTEQRSEEEEEIVTSNQDVSEKKASLRHSRS
ncbi:MAG: hypothetical protein BGO43_00420 [Gammaproteobacteria bacterium 39-13]|nr:hypothetical protein [Gammaproteobacteria bacterium]OJV96722.1 MAG: hypothetical protein BGO43_00420 [Gammaproteobacteria bacterium 39-13]